jgi:hypothetical protein
MPFGFMTPSTVVGNEGNLNLLASHPQECPTCSSHGWKIYFDGGAPITGPKYARPAPPPPPQGPQPPDCGKYAAQINNMPRDAQLGFIAADKELPFGTKPEDVLIICSLTSSVVGGVDLAEGNIPGMLQQGQQAEIADCEAGRNLIPFVTLPACTPR